MEIVSSPINRSCRSLDVWTKSKLCSRLTAASLHTKNSTCNKLPPHKRKVWFGPPTIHEYSRDCADDLSPEEFSELWWSRDEFDSIMSAARIAANEARHHPIVAGGLDQAFQFAIRTAALLGQNGQLNEHLLEMKDDQRGLKLWCQYDRSRRGLEKYTSRQYNIVRRKQREDLNKRVLSLSKQGADPEEIRQVAERTSRLSVVFSRMFAIADHNASRDCILGLHEITVPTGYNF